MATAKRSLMKNIEPGYSKKSETNSYWTDSDDSDMGPSEPKFSAKIDYCPYCNKKLKQSTDSHVTLNLLSDSFPVLGA